MELSTAAEAADQMDRRAWMGIKNIVLVEKAKSLRFVNIGFFMGVKNS